MLSNRANFWLICLTGGVSLVSTQYSPPASPWRPGMTAGRAAPVKSQNFSNYENHTLNLTCLVCCSGVRPLGWHFSAHEFLQSFLVFLPSPWRNSAGMASLHITFLIDWLTSPSTVRTSLGVANHLTHLYEDTVHAGRLVLTGKTFLLHQTVGDGHTVANTGVVVIAVTPPPAHVLHPTAHRRQHQQRDKSWEREQI